MIHSSWTSMLGALLTLTLAAAPAAALPGEVPAGTEASAAAGVVINEAYLNGGSAGAPYTHKFVELYNSTDAPVSLDGWSLQYRSASGTSAPTGLTALNGTIPARGYFLIQGGSNSTNGEPLPAPDVLGTLNTAAGGGTIILARQSFPVDPLPTGSVVGMDPVADLLGYGSSNTFETAPSSAPGSTTNQQSLNRTNAADSDNNQADFTLSASITPTNSGSTGSSPEPPPAGAVTPISKIQGDAAATPFLGQTVTTRGIVTAAYPTGGFGGYYVQTPGTGGTAERIGSDALFIYSPATVPEVAVGDYVQVSGTAGEYFGLTQLSVPAGAMTILDSPAEAVKVTSTGLPADPLAREALEGMLLQPDGPFTVSDNYALNQYGEITLAAGTTALVQPTEVAPPGTPENAAVAADNAARSVKLDDGATTNFLSAANRSRVLPYLTIDQPIRVHSRVGFTSPVILDYRNSSWKFQPLGELSPDTPTTVQPAAFSGQRPAAPEAVGGNLSIASFNVLNYFTTTGDQLSGCTYYTDRDGNPITVRGGCEARGAANAENLERQEAKIVAAITGLGADVVSLEEIENSAKFGKDRDESLATLTAALNEREPGAWDYVRSPTARPALEDEDVIRTAFIYRTSVVEPVGESVILNDTVAFANARKPLAQAFTPQGHGPAGTFVVIANHFKSKGSAPSSGPNADQGDGQGAWNAARVAQATALVDFAGQVSADAGTAKVFLTGDFNSYSAEDPMQVLYEAGYVNQGAVSGKYSYVFGGLSGSLDHILAAPAADALVTGSDLWNINAVESVALEYSRFNNNITNYYSPDPYRASDHDPLIVGLETGPAPCLTSGASQQLPHGSAWRARCQAPGR